MQARHDGRVMKQQVTGWRALWLAVSLLAGACEGAAVLATPAGAADMEEDPAAALRLSQKSSRNCTGSCMAECRAERTVCTDGKTDDEGSCRAQFQICVRRCVISCSPN
jgi:hypothetical protein